MPTYTFDPSEGPSPEELAAQQAALDQGEKLVQAHEEAKARKFEQIDTDNEGVDLIAGKFKSQEDLVKAYEELQKKLGSEASAEEPSEEVEPSEERVAEETPEEEVSPAADAIKRASDVYAQNGDLSEESIEELSQLDSKDLIKAYLESYKANAAQVQQASMQQAEVDSLMASAGGAEQYNEMVQWAASNFSADEIGAFNQATQNAASARFAIEALKNRYTAANGAEPPLVTGKRAASALQGFRSQAELGRAIADPRYSTDPAYRQDVEQRLARSGDLL